MKFKSIEKLKRTWKLVELDGAVNRSRSETSGVGAEGKGGDAIPMVAEDFGWIGREERIMDGDNGLGRGGGDQVVGLLVPQDGAEGAITS